MSRLERRTESGVKTTPIAHTVTLLMGLFSLPSLNARSDEAIVGFASRADIFCAKFLVRD